MARTRAALAEIGVSQPEWWVLHQLSLHRDGIERAELIDTVGPNDGSEAIVHAISDAGRKGWLVEQGDVLALTPAGTEVFDRAAEVQVMLDRERRQGIGDDEFETTISVLQRTITNVGGHAWHW